MNPELNAIARYVLKCAALIAFVFFVLYRLALGQLPPMPQGLVGPAPAQTLTVKLEWDHSVTPEVVGYRIYRSYTRTNPVWVVASLVTYTNRVTVLATNWPVWFAATAVTTNSESEKSNFVGVMGEDKILSVWSEVSATNPAGPFKYLAPVVTLTNPPGSQFYRVGISNHTKLRTD